MEKNFKLEIERDYHVEHLEVAYFEHLGQAIVRVKTFGREQRIADKCPLHYWWSVAAYNDDAETEGIRTANGTYDREWNPIIENINAAQ